VSAVYVGLVELYPTTTFHLKAISSRKIHFKEPKKKKKKRTYSREDGFRHSKFARRHQFFPFNQLRNGSDRSGWHQLMLAVSRAEWWADVERAECGE
jgi:hypothetical protein